MDNKGTMQDIEFPTTDMLGPKPPVNTPELLAAQIGSLTLDDLGKFTVRFQIEDFIQACLRGDKGQEIQNSRLAALHRKAREGDKLQYPHNMDKHGWKEGGLGGDGHAVFEAEMELNRLIYFKYNFEKKSRS